ncbi:MAG: hypothetical protein ACLGG9_11185 [Thermoleophilia bacterium]|jgi:hypothetical protein
MRPTRVRRSPIAVALLAMLTAMALLAAAGCGGDDGDGPGAAVDPALVADVQAAAEVATGATFTEATPPEGGADEGVGAVLTSGSDPQNGQRIVISIGTGDRPNAISEEMKAELGELANFDVTTGSSELGWGTKVIKGLDTPIYIVYFAEAPTKEELDQVDRSDELKAAMSSFGFSE